MRLSNHRRCQLAGHVDRDAAGSVAIPRSFGAARRRRCQFGFLARELSLWRGAGALWRAVSLPCPQSYSHRRDRAVQARLGAWVRLPRCTVCRIRGHLARTQGDLALTHGGQTSSAPWSTRTPMPRDRAPGTCQDPGQPRAARLSDGRGPEAAGARALHGRHRRDPDD
jgi:hypothetical protein